MLLTHGRWVTLLWSEFNEVYKRPVVESQMYQIELWHILDQGVFTDFKAKDFYKNASLLLAELKFIYSQRFLLVNR